MSAVLEKGDLLNAQESIATRLRHASRGVVLSASHNYEVLRDAIFPHDGGMRPRGYHTVQCVFQRSADIPADGAVAVAHQLPIFWESRVGLHFPHVLPFEVQQGA